VNLSWRRAPGPTGTATSASQTIAFTLRPDRDRRRAGALRSRLRTAGGGAVRVALCDKTDLQDITKNPKFTAEDRPGTFGNATKSEKIDYNLLSPPLFSTRDRRRDTGSRPRCSR
jgi:hypothetical protein